MNKRLLYIFFLCFIITRAVAQPYGNEWIVYSQNYYKIKVASNGIYRVDSATLANAGIAVGVGGIDPRNLQLFNKGKEQSIYIQGDGDGQFNAGDFLEFYGAKNDGTLDSLLYVNSSFIPNPYYSLINDTAVYYLTWNSALTNKRMSFVTDTAFSSFGFPAENYFWNDEVLSLPSEYYEGETDGVGGTDSRYTKAEGWFGGTLNLGAPAITYSVSTAKKYSGGPNPLIKMVVLGASKNDNLIYHVPPIPDHHLNITYAGSGSTALFKDTTFFAYEANRFIVNTIPVSALGNASTDFNFSSIADPGFISNRTAVAYIEVKYPHQFDLEGKNNFTMYVPDNASHKSLLDISNFSGTGSVYLYDLSNATRMNVTSVGINYKVFLPIGTGTDKKCFITSDGSITNVSSIQPVTPSAQFTNFSSMVVDSAFVIVTNKVLMSSVTNYKNYRSTAIYGGFHHVIIADIEELYDQFAYGVMRSPLSVRGFCDLLLDLNPTAPPQNLFLIGKSLHIADYRQNATNYTNCLVPSLGNPSSDNLFTIGLTDTSFAPAIPTGRLAARTNLDVDNYLEKVKQFEDTAALAPGEWMKNILHFGGGLTSAEQSQLKGYLNGYKTIIQDTLFGGKVKDFFKTSSSPIEINTSDTLRDLINSGVTMMTFFGHASGSGFDQSIDDVNSYDPLPGHYPFLLANSCYAGDLHAVDNTASGSPLSSSETFVLTQNKGMIGYLGSVGLGVPYALNYFSDRFYRQLSYKNYGGSVGSSIKRAIEDIDSTYILTDQLTRSTCYELTLHGDPSIKLAAYPKPDYKIINSNVYFDQPPTDSFTVYAIRTNLGKAIHDSIFTEFTRTFPNGDTASFIIRTLAPKFKDTISIKLYNDYSRGVGLNHIKVMLDSYDDVDELNESNNATTDVDFIINGGDIIPVYPYEFAIIPKDTITLKASTANPFAASKTYIFEIDTTDRYNSAFAFRTTTIIAPGGVVSWKPPITFADSTVYYWRVSPDSLSPTSGYSWKESSFQYIPNKHGWEQAHYFQFKNDAYRFVKYNRPARSYIFVNDVKNIKCIDGIFPNMIWTNIVWKLNNYIKDYWTCVPGVNEGFNFAVIDPISGENSQSPVPVPIGAAGVYGNFHCRTYPMNTFDFKSGDSLLRNTIVDFINNPIAVPNGSYVLAYSMNNTHIPTYDSNFKNAFHTLGSSMIDSVKDDVPYILWGKKGSAPGSAVEIVGDSANSIIQLDQNITTNWAEGSVSSPVIGPATSWDSLSWRWHVTTVDPSRTDSIKIRVIGIDTAGIETTLANFDTTTLNYTNLGALVPASTYPRIRLVAYMKDNVYHTPAQMDRWQVFFTPVPEAAINPPMGYSFPVPTVQEGDEIHLKLPIENIGELPFTEDSLLVTYWIEDVSHVNHDLPSKLKKKPFNVGEILIDTINVSTLGYPGANALWVEVNPIGRTHSQLEQYHFNNVVRIPFSVSGDKINPLLDVTFDGVHILNNDIVSAKPNILVQLKDENMYRALNDTSDFKLFIKTPSGSLASQIWFSNPMITFIPAVLPDNSCKINYTPYLPEDGIYQMIVQAKDRSDNLSGAINYKINFDVVNKATITEVMNYPNPFSTSTRFVFTMTGSEIPTNFKIQIMTITGKVVREIFQDEIGPLHIGRNITQFAWDGKDEFGDQLANGVYLYRVVTKLNGEDIEKRETDADQYFKKGWGKMYLIR